MWLILAISFLIVTFTFVAFYITDFLFQVLFAKQKQHIISLISNDSKDQKKVHDKRLAREQSSFHTCCPCMCLCFVFGQFFRFFVLQ